MRSLTKTGIRILSAKYRSILIKCAIINASVFIGAFGATSAMAANVADWGHYRGAVNNESDATIKVNDNITYDGSVGEINVINRSLSIIKNTEGNDTNLILDGKHSDVSQIEGLTVGTGGALTLTNITMQNFKNTGNGGAIANVGTISSIAGNFNSNSADGSGGAIYNYAESSNTNVGNITGDFTSNSANGFGGAGGAIYNYAYGSNANIGNITGNFTSNSVGSGGAGGAIYNFATLSAIGSIGNITGDFISNSAGSSGGAICNYARGNGQATLSILATNNKDVTFNGNYVTSSSGMGGAIYNKGEDATAIIGLYADANRKITFVGGEDVIDTEYSENSKYDIDGIFNMGILNINGDGTITPYTGTVNLYTVSDAATAKGTTNIYGGTVNVAKDITQNNINVLSGATLSSTTNGASIVANDTFTNAGTVNMSGDDSELAAVNLNNNGTIDAINVVTDVLLTNNNTINATGIEVGDILTNNGAIDAVNLLATQITNNGNITTTDTKFGIANNNSGASLTVNGKVNSGISTAAILINEGNVTINGDAEKRIQLGNSGTANFNGRLDAGNSVIQLVENDGGIMNFSTNAIESTANLPINVFKMNGGSVNIADGSVNTLHINQLNLTGNTNFAIDADLGNEEIDKIKIHDIDNSEIAAGTMININKINLLSDATQEKINLSIFADTNTKNALINHVNANIKGLQYSPIYTYDANYNQTEGEITFTRHNSGTSDDFNPYIYAPSGVANTTAAMTTQIATLAMDKMDDVVHTQGRSGGDTPTSSNVWVKVMGLNDNVEFNNFENIDSKALTVAAGVNTDKITCGDCGIVFGAYAGYIGGKQHYTANDIDQNGGYVGLSSALTLRNAFLTATVNGGLLKNKANNMYGSDRFNTLWLGTGLKAGYNYAITDSVVFQPNVYGGYTLVNTQDYTSVSGVKIATNNLNFFEIDPGLKLSAVIADGWTGSVQGKYAIVMDNGADITANDFALQNISTKNYIEYGIGIDKSVTDAFYLGAQINRHDGGRTGWNGSIEFRYKF